MENGFLDLGETLKAKTKAVEQVEPVLAKLSRDQVIIRKGDLVTEEEALQIRALSEYSANVSISSIAGNALYVLIVFALCPFLLTALAPALKRSQLAFLAGIILSYLALAAVIFNLLEAPAGPAAGRVPADFRAVHARVPADHDPGGVRVLAGGLAAAAARARPGLVFLFLRPGHRPGRRGGGHPGRAPHRPAAGRGRPVPGQLPGPAGRRPAEGRVPAGAAVGAGLGPGQRLPGQPGSPWGCCRPSSTC